MKHPPGTPVAPPRSSRVSAGHTGFVAASTPCHTVGLPPIVALAAQVLRRPAQSGYVSRLRVDSLPSGTGPGPDPAGAHRKSGKHRKPAEPSRLWAHVVTLGGVLHKASIVMALLAPLAVTR